MILSTLAYHCDKLWPMRRRNVLWLYILRGGLVAVTRKMLSNPVFCLQGTWLGPLHHVQGPLYSLLTEASAGQSETGFYFSQHQSYPSLKFLLTTFIFKFLETASYFPSRLFRCLREVCFQKSYVQITR